MTNGGEVFDFSTEYRQYYIYWSAEFWESLQNWDRMFAGQREVVSIGAADGNGIIFQSLQDDAIRLLVEVLSSPVGEVVDEWSDVSEVSVSIPSGVELVVATWADVATFPLFIESGPYRLRYSRRTIPNPGYGSGVEELFDEEPLLEIDRVQFWPADPEPDRIVRR